jgi:hypothetical protein
MPEEEYDKILLRLSKKLIKEIDEIAEEEHRDRTAQITVMLEEWFEARK